MKMKNKGWFKNGSKKDFNLFFSKNINYMKTKKIEMLFSKNYLSHESNQSTFNANATMSRTNSKNNANNNANNKASKPFCKVCQDAGKPESVFTSHFVRSTTQPGSIVTCPTLLAMECRFCHTPGHTVKYCTILEERKRIEKKREKQNARANNPAPTETVKKSETQKNPQNIFSCLDSYDSDSETETETNVEPRQAISTGHTTYASIVSKPIAAPMPLKEDPVFEKLEPKVESAPAPKVSQPIQHTFRNFPMKSWADWSDSEDDEDIVPPKPVLRRQPSLYENYNHNLELLPSEQPKLERHIATYGGRHTNNLIDNSAW